MRKSIQSSISNSDAVSVDAIKETGGFSEIRQAPEPVPDTLPSPSVAPRRGLTKLREGLLEGLVEAILDSLLG